MKFVINLMLLLLIAICTHQGFKKGLLGSLITLGIMIVSLIISNIVATKLSKELVPAVQPFVSGYIDSETSTDTIMENLGYGDSDLSLNDIMEKDSSLRYDYAYECMREFGISKDISDDLANDAVKYADTNQTSITDSVIIVISNSAAYVIVVTIAFIMIMILLCTIFDMFNFDLSLPSLDVVDEISGAAVGLITGFFLCVLLCWLLGFLGLIIGKETSDRDALLRFFQAFRFITRTLI